MLLSSDNGFITVNKSTGHSQITDQEHFLYETYYKGLKSQYNLYTG